LSKIIQFVFVQGKSGISIPIRDIEELGEKLRGEQVEDFIPTHVGIKVDDQFAEALLTSGFAKEDISKYTADQIKIYDVEITDEENIKAGDAMFTACLGQKYAVNALVDGAAFTLLDLKLPEEQGKDDCSGYDTKIARSYGLDILGDTPDSSITPLQFMHEIEKIGKEHIDAA
jgi:hypothetical protein